jgi:ADP-ribose pyrophosphatase YjhB (NUDIX family)
MSEQLARQFEQDEASKQWFKQESLLLLAQQLATSRYPGYPSKRLSYASPRGVQTLAQRLHLPIGEWDTGVFPNTPGDAASDLLYDSGLRLDTFGRPLHPWIEAMLDPRIGVVTGRGFYRNWGPNFTADPVIMRTDTSSPMVLLIKRNDTSLWALPGGFVEPGEPAEVAALREAQEETLLDWTQFAPRITPIYQGPLADLRVTAHAWPETTAYAVTLHPQLSARLSTNSFQGDKQEVQDVAWFAIDNQDTPLFGSHKLLIELAAKQL